MIHLIFILMFSNQVVAFSPDNAFYDIDSCVSYANRVLDEIPKNDPEFKDGGFGCFTEDEYESQKKQLEYMFNEQHTPPIGFL